MTNAQPRLYQCAVQATGAALIALISAAQPGQAQQAPAAVVSEPASTPVGEYTHSEMELVAGIRLDADGTFLYGLTVGSLDERAQGRWKSSGDRIELTSDPRPVAPTIAAGAVDPAQGEPFAIRVLAPNKRDVPGVTFLLEFENGEPLESYTQGGRWTLPPEEGRTPRFITFSMPSYRLRSGRLPLEGKAGTVATFILTPNDFGVADLTGAQAELRGDTLTLYRLEGTMKFQRRRE